MLIVVLCILSMVLAFMTVMLIMFYRMNRYYEECIEKEIDKVHKFIEFYDVLVQWIQLKQVDKRFVRYLEENNYHTVAIYGMKELGQMLLTELQQDDANIVCVIDKNAQEIDGEYEIPIISDFNILPEVDVIIVTPVHYFNNIYKELRLYTEAEIVSIDDLLWSI